jgi:uncharacterized protein (TIGR03382 family)
MLRSAFRLAAAGAALAVVMTVSTMAQPADKRTYFTFSGPVVLPGVNLPAGKYLFRLGDPTSGRRIVQVMSEDGRKPIGLFFSIPSQRPDVPEDPEVRFIETPRGAPAAIKTWWYPGERTGFEFIYPKDQARRLAQAASQPVLTTQTATTKAEETSTGDLARISPSGEETAVSSEQPVTAASGTSQRGEIAAPENASATRATEAAPARSTRTELPRTATPIPTAAVSGTLALLAAAGLWLSRRRKLS